jgi:nicotinamide riboside kinase
MARPIRVALMGAHGTGKTTLSGALVERLNRLGIKAVSLPEAPRLICDRAGDPTFFRRGSNTPLRQDLILLVHLLQELNSLLCDVGVVISDRSLLDHWAYTLALFDQELIDEGLSRIYDSFIADHCRNYDLIFFLPIEFEVVDDGTREGDRDFQSGIQRNMLDLVQKYGLHVLMTRGSLEERTDFCLGAIMSTLGVLEKGGQNVGFQA